MFQDNEIVCPNLNTMKTSTKFLIRNVPLVLMALALSLLSVGCSAQTATTELPTDVTRVPVVFAGGHETLGVDRGRPVVLIAAALGVAPEVFREAFSRVHPAGPDAGGPTEAEARQNKDALLGALGKYGVTNERLDEVSNFYRYPPGRGGVWKNTPAKANALVKNGVITGYEVTDGGAGYSSPPTISVAGMDTANANVELSFGQDFDTNGAVRAIKTGRETPTVGDRAPDFELTSLSGAQVRLSGTLQKGPVVLVMLRGYPGYQCPICTAQVGQMLNKTKQLQNAGANVLLVYPGPADGLKARAAEFVQGKDIPANFNLLLDPDYKFTNLYGLRWDAPRETAYPATFVLDKNGNVLFAKVSQSHGDRAKIDDVLAALPR